MSHNIMRLGAYKHTMAAVSVAAVTLASGGVAAADASISYTGPHSTNIIGGYGGWSSSDWNNWNPDNWYHQGRNYDDWNREFNNWCNLHRHDYRDNHHNNDNYRGNDSDWNSWSPWMYEQHGRSFDDWCRESMNHGHDRFNYDRDHHDSHDNNYYGGRGSDNNYDPHHDSYARYDNNHNDNHDNNYGGYGGDNHHVSYNNDNHNNDRYGGNGGYGGDNFRLASYRNNVDVHNNNDVNVHNNTDQTATSGDASSYRNTRSGDVTTGNASNTSNNDTSVNIDNSSSSSLAHNNYGGSGGDSSISYTGPDSYNRVSRLVRNNTNVTNNNDVSVTNDTTQTATSGDATSSRNTRGGDVSTGNATNRSDNQVSVDITN